MLEHSALAPGTVAIHIGNEAEAGTGAVVPAVSLSTTFERGAENIYARSSNPNRSRLEATLAVLEGGKHCLTYSSGMAAITAVFTSGILQSGDRSVAIRALYGGTAAYLQHLLPEYGITVDYVDDFETSTAASRATVQKTIQGAKLVYVESPTNPTCQVTDLSVLAELCHETGALLCVDGTFASPIVTRPLDLGADLVLHSATKYLNGHADVTMGVLVLNSDELATRLRFRRNITGAVPSPFDCYLCSRGLKTLHLRVREASATAAAIAAYLCKSQSENVSHVNYALLSLDLRTFLTTDETDLAHSQRQFDIARKQNLNGLGGGMISFRLRGATTAIAESFCGKLNIFRWAVSLGSVESLVEVPGSSLTHRALPKDERERMGIYEDLVRISCGCEDVDDLIADLQSAFSIVFGPSKAQRLNAIS
ncbi:cystathionine gamma-lyase cys3 [Savitreella phatthalungensis]